MKGSEERPSLDHLPAIFTAKMTGSAVRTGANVDAEPLHLDELPGAMDKMGWVIGAKMLRRWLNTEPAYRMPAGLRGGSLPDGTPLDYRATPASQLDEKIIKMEWALNFDQVSEMFEHSVRNWKTENAVRRLRELLIARAGWSQGKSVKLGYGLPRAKELEWYCQVNSRAFGRYTDRLDDFYAAMFKANMKVAVRGQTRRLWTSKSDIFEVEKLGVYMRDTYDFNAQSAEDFLIGVGVWSRDRMLSKIETADYKLSSYLARALKYPGFVAVQNSDFWRWQDSRKRGGDFFVFSDVKWVDSDVDHVVI